MQHGVGGLQVTSFVRNVSSDHLVHVRVAAT